MKLAIILKITLGFLALSFATVGLFLPVWPTTPFVLVAIGCFSSTPRLRNKLLQIKYFREYYESYTNGTGIANKTLAISLCFLWGMLILSMFLVGEPWVILLLVGVGICVSIHILSKSNCFK